MLLHAVIEVFSHLGMQHCPNIRPAANITPPHFETPPQGPVPVVALEREAERHRGGQA